MAWEDPPRIWRVPVNAGDALQVRLKRHALSVSVNQLHVYTFDREGRPVGVFHAGRHYRRGLDNRVLEQWGGPGPALLRRQRQWLTTEERAEFFGALLETVAAVDRALSAGWVEAQAEGVMGRQASTPVRQALEQVLQWDVQRLEAERERFLRVYRPVTIVPPDQYLSVVVQMTEGCPWNECAFCDFYRDRRYRVKSDQELEVHLGGVQELLGEGIRLRKAVFLADANAVAVPQGRLLEMMARLRARLPMLPEGLSPDEQRLWRRSRPAALDGFTSFVDAFTSGRKPASAFAEMGAMGLRRLYLGAETGDDELLTMLHKPTTREEMVDAVRRMKEGGLRVGVIFLLGIGGRRFAEQHRRSTLAALQAMPLTAGDLIYLSPLVIHPDLPYARWMVEEGIEPLSIVEMAEQEDSLRAGLTAQLRRGVRVAPYDIREFLY